MNNVAKYKMVRYTTGMYVSELIIDFLEYLEIERGRSQKTTENYHLYLNRVIEFNGDIPIEKIDSETAEAFTQTIIQEITQDTHDITQHLWPDMSYLQILPLVPFYKSNELETVAQYFNAFIVSDPPGAEQLDELQDDIRDKLGLLAKEESRISVKERSLFDNWSSFFRS